MHFNMILPGLEEVTVIKAELNEGIYEIYIEMPVKTHICSSCLRETRRVHDYRIQRIKHLKMAVRQTVIVYRKRRGMSQRDISSVIEEIYGFSVSHDMISDMTDQVLADLEEWQSRPLSSCYAFLFVDCMFTTIRNQYETKKYAVYTILGYTIEGEKELLDLWLNETESARISGYKFIFDEIKVRSVEDVSCYFS